MGFTFPRIQVYFKCKTEIEYLIAEIARPSSQVYFSQFLVVKLELGASCREEVVDAPAQLVSYLGL